jgi:hypothetical protein
MADKQIVPYSLDLNQPPPTDDSLAIVPVRDPSSLVVVPSTSKPRSYE